MKKFPILWKSPKCDTETQCGQTLLEKWQTWIWHSNNLHNSIYIVLTTIYILCCIHTYLYNIFLVLDIIHNLRGFKVYRRVNLGYMQIFWHFTSGTWGFRILVSTGDPGTNPSRILRDNYNIDKGAWWDTVLRVTESDMTKAMVHAS